VEGLPDGYIVLCRHRKTVSLTTVTIIKIKAQNGSKAKQTWRIQRWCWVVLAFW